MTAAKRKEMMKRRRKRRRGQLNALLMLLWECFRFTPVAIGIIGDYMRVLFYSHYTTITGWGVLLRNAAY